MKKLSKTLSVLLLNGVVSLLLLELLLRIYNPIPTRIKADEIILPINQKYVIKNSNISKLDKEIIHTKNSSGMRGPEKPDNFDRYISIIAIGGSTTECFYLSDGKDWSSLLMKKLNSSSNKFWLNNAGLDGHSTFGHKILLQNHVSTMKPNYVLYLVGCNDISRNDLRQFDKSILTDQSSTWKNFLLKKSEVLSLLNTLARAYSAFKMGVTHRNLDLEKLNHVIVDSVTLSLENEKHADFLILYETRLKELISLTRHLNIKPILITQPTLLGDGVDDLTGVNLETVEYAGFNGQVYWSALELYNTVTKNVGKKTNTVVIDLANKLPKSSRYFYDGLHYTNEGAEKISDILSQELMTSVFRDLY